MTKTSFDVSKCDALHAPFITMAFLCLPVIPELKITDRSLWDSKNMQMLKP